MKAAGPDGVPGRFLKVCADQLTGVLTNIFNLSLQQAVVPTYFKTSIIVPVPKKSPVKCLNYYQPVALTLIAMKCFERLVLSHMKSVIPPDLDKHQFAYRNNHSTEDAITTVLHLALTHLETPNTYVRYVILALHLTQLSPTSRPPSCTTSASVLCAWVLDFLTDRPQQVRVGRNISSTLTLRTGTPVLCAESKAFYIVHT